MASRIAFKDSSVRLSVAALDPCMVRAYHSLLRTAPPLHGDVVILTSIDDGRHSKASLHYVGRAMDVRFTGDRPGGIDMDASRQPAHPTLEAEAQAWAKRLRQQLGPAYDVVVESDHIHLEWDPKR